MASTCSPEDLRDRTNEVLSHVTTTKQPVFVEKHGRSSVVLLDADTYLEQIQALEEFRRIFEHGIPGKPQDIVLAQITAERTSGRLNPDNLPYFDVEKDNAEQANSQ